MAELHGAGSQQVPVAGQVVVEAVPERSAGEASTSGRDGSESSASTAPPGESFEGLRDATRPLRVNGQRVYKMADYEVERLAGDRPAYTVDYFTTGVTINYLAALREEFEIPENVELVVPGREDLPSRPPPGYITISAEYLRAGLRLPFPPFLRLALTRFNVAPMQLNANAYRILVGCFVLWKKKFGVELPLRVFQNLYRMKSAPSSAGSYYFQGHKGTFITGCSDSDKQYKHLWFFVGGRWLHGQRSYREVPRSERVPVAFRRGYVWTRAPHVDMENQRRVSLLRELPDPEGTSTAFYLRRA